MTLITVTPNPSVDRTLEVPGLAVGRHLKGRLVRVQPGGKGINVARCLAALGVPSVVTGIVGQAELGLFRDSFAGTAVTLELVPTPRPTRTCTTILDPESHTDTHIREEGSHVDAQEIEVLRAKLNSLACPDALVVFCGSLPPGMTASALTSLVEACHARRAQVAADLNGPDLRAALRARLLMAKPNVQELGECLGRDLRDASEPELLAAATELLNRAETILVTRGRDGAFAVRSGEALAGRVEIGAPRNTVGCGDAFLAGYLAALWRGEPLRDALRLALACGAAQALAEAPGRLSATLVRQLAKRARFRQLPLPSMPDPLRP